MDYSKAFKMVKDSVVMIKNGNGTGTGSIVGDGTLILTCHHCVFPINNLSVEHPFLKTSKTATILSSDQASDIALLKIDSKIGAPISLESNLPSIGEETFALGFPYGINEIVLLPALIASIPNTSMFRLNSSINHGNSGGPLINHFGKQIGIVNAKHGSLSAFLDKMENSGAGVSVNFGGFDPIGSVQQLIKEMRYNLNLGIGYAIPIHKLNSLGSVFSSLLTS